MSQREALIKRRDDAVDNRDLAAALQLDNRLEDLGVHADDRATCWSCQDWADHAHRPLTGERITLAQYRAQR